MTVAQGSDRERLGALHHFPSTELKPLAQQPEVIGLQDRGLAALSAARAALARAARAMVACLALAPAIAAAQQIGGTVTDATGAVLPGVTVEARSPALIEQVRTAVSDGNGQYLIVALETGAYTVTYRLPGFGIVVREGIELNSGFAATVDVRLAVGELAETITVSEARPVVDIQNVVQRAVMDREVIDSIPTGKSLVSYGLLVPGMVGAESYGTSLAQDSGGLTSQTMQRMSIHGGSRHDQLLHLNGLDVGDAWTQGASLAYFPDTNFEEISFDYSANGADVETGGVVVNMIPREGGNRFSGSTFATFTFPALHADNLDQALIDRGLPSGTLVDENWTVSPSVGGPLVRDRLWFFLTHNRQRADLKAPGVFEAIDPRALVFEPDPTRPTIDEALVTEQSINFTLQPTARDKFKAYWTNSATDRPRQLQGRTLGSVFITPDAAGAAEVRTNVYQAAWVRPHTNRLLFEAGASRQPIRLVFGPSATAVTELPGVFEVAPFRASRNTSAWLSGPTSRRSPKNIRSYRASLSYVTGSHNLKVGATLLQQRIAVSEESDANWLSLWTLRGAPFRATYWGTSDSANYASPTLGIYAQEQWTRDRLTVNAGLRWDYVKAGYPDQVRPTNDWVPQAFAIPGAVVVSWKDLQPRLGLAYDLRGDGRTAVKLSASRYGARESSDWAERVNPAVSNRRQDRSWNDGATCLDPAVCIPGDGLPQGDPTDPAPNGELLSPNVNLAFGEPLITLVYDPEWAFGWGRRRSNWEYAASLQHELAAGLSLDVGYFRRHQVNHSVRDDRAVGLDDFDIASVTVPVDPRLPGGGGGTLHFYDLKPGSVRLPDQTQTSAAAYGGERETWNGVDLTLGARLAALLLQGGVSTGRASLDYCGVQDILPERTWLYRDPTDPSQFVAGDATPLEHCRQDHDWLTQVKLIASYALPSGVQVAGTVQSQPGPERSALLQFTDTSLGRDLTSYPGGVQLNLVPPGSFYGERFNQIDLRLTKVLDVGAGAGRLRAMFDVFNVFNANTVTKEQYGMAFAGDPNWLAPQVIMPGRLAKLAFQLDF